jgi:hypothetical protein
VSSKEPEEKKFTLATGLDIVESKEGTCGLFK